MDDRKTFRAIDYFEPYPKQLAFFALSATKRESLLTSGNQYGKTWSGGAASALHLTGEYPAWWPGRRFSEPVRMWICGETSLKVRDTQQKVLCGTPGVTEKFGTGMIPKAAFCDKPSLSRGVTDAFDTIQVRHKSGGISVGIFKSYDQGRSKFEGETLHAIWDDEEPPMDIYTEQLARITTTAGIIYVTYTSMRGETALTDRFYKQESPDRGMVTMGLVDAKHIPVADHEKIIAGYPEHERVARVYGGIMRGEGRVFTVPEAAISEPPLEYIPPFWRKLWGVDFGIGHPFGAVLILWDLDTDTIHVHHAIRMQDALPLMHWQAMKLIGADVPVAWPKDGADREKSTGEPLAAQYKKHGAKMLSEHATWPDGSMSTWAGITEMQEREKTGRIKVAAHLTDWFEERRNYHVTRNKLTGNTELVKVKDDLMSATRIAIMMKRFARSVELGAKQVRLSQSDPAARFAVGSPSHPGGTFDVFTGR